MKAFKKVLAKGSSSESLRHVFIRIWEGLSVKCLLSCLSNSLKVLKSFKDIYFYDGQLEFV